MNGAEEQAQRLPNEFTFPKKERLSSKKVIQELFQKGSSFTLYPFKVIYLFSDAPVEEYPQVMFTVPKRNFKKAHDRNLIRRRCKEAYRLNKHLIHSNITSPKPGLFIAAVAFIYTGKEIFLYWPIEKKLSLALQRLAKVNEERPQ
jgi:ribonuclease P protein component